MWPNLPTPLKSRAVHVGFLRVLKPLSLHFQVDFFLEGYEVFRTDRAYEQEDGAIYLVNGTTLRGPAGGGAETGAPGAELRSWSTPILWTSPNS